MIAKKRHIYYVPGMISLVILPIICMIYLQKINYEERALEIIIPSKYDPNHNAKNALVFDTSVLSIPKYKRNYTTIDIDGDAQMNKEKLELFNNKVGKLISTRDTLNGIHLRFGNGFTYGNLIEAINICNFKDTVNSYIFYENNLWYLRENISTEQKLKIIKRREANIKDQNKIEKTRIMERAMALSNEPVSKRVKDILKAWPCFVALLLLGVVSIRSMIKE